MEESLHGDLYSAYALLPAPELAGWTLSRETMRVTHIDPTKLSGSQNYVSKSSHDYAYVRHTSEN